MLNLVTVALPNLIAHELVIVHPMSSMSGYVTYIEYVAGKKKGEVNNGDLFNSPFKLGDVNETYTSDRVVETVSAAGDLTPSWTPVVEGAFEVKDGETTKKYDVKITTKDNEVKYANLSNGKVTELAAGDRVAYVYNNIVVPQNDLPMLKAEMKSIPLIAKARRIAVDKYAA